MNFCMFEVLYLLCVFRELIIPVRRNLRLWKDYVRAEARFRNVLSRRLLTRNNDVASEDSAARRILTSKLTRLRRPPLYGIGARLPYKANVAVSFASLLSGSPVARQRDTRRPNKQRDRQPTATFISHCRKL